MKQKLVMSFDPRTIEHLGVKMYSHLPNAIAELVANSYDADAKNVTINLYDKEEKKIIVEDDGNGMSFEEVNDFFLRIGRNRRKEGFDKSPSGRRKATGKKGLGKLSLFGIGNTIEIETIQKKSGKKTSFLLDWDELINTTSKEYEPKFKISDCEKKLKGTKIILKNLQRKTTFDDEGLSISLSKLFNLFDNSFNVFIIRNDGKKIKIDSKLKYENLDIQFEWPYSQLISRFDALYENKERISGKIISTTKPLKPELRGITIFANGRLVNAPEYFGISESSHGFSYITGWLDIDFIDDWKEDVISTNRQSINWDMINTIQLREYLKKFMSHVERTWRTKRNQERKKAISKTTNINILSWFNNLPREIRTKVEPIIETITEKSELSIGEQTNTVQNLHQLVPDYPYYHWRHLHKSIHEVSEEDYKKGDYFRAADEAVKKFIKSVQKKSNAKDGNGNNRDGQDLMFNAFGEKGILKFTSCLSDTEKNLENGQKYLSAGSVVGFRNPVSHETKNKLYPSIFCDKDCLDILSLLSYLFGKLDQSQ